MSFGQRRSEKENIVGNRTTSGAIIINQVFQSTE